MRAAVIALATLASIGTLQAQQNAPLSGTAPLPGGGNVIVVTAPPPPERDKCDPLHVRLDEAKCDSMLSPTRTIRMRPGTQRTMRFDRSFARVELDSVPLAAIDVTPGGSDTIAIIDARQVGTAEVYVFGERPNAREGNPVRDVLFAGTIIVSEDAPADVSVAIRVHNRGNLSATTDYNCAEGGGCQSGLPRTAGSR